jgi:hypothetical protein
MRTILRLLVLGCLATGSLALAGTVLAKTPQLLVKGSPATAASAETVIEVKEVKEDAAPLRIGIYLPSGYTANITQAAGTQIGTVNADLQALLISPDAIIQAEGTVLTADPATYVTNTCAPGSHAAVWLLHVTVSGQTLDVPVYVDPTTGAEAAFSSAKLVLCLPNPYEQAQPPASRAPFGAKIIDAKLTMAAGVITNPSAAATYLWRAVVTPWTVNSPLPNQAATVETQAIVNLPAAATLRAKVKTTRVTKRVRGKRRTIVANSVLLSGRLLEKLQGVAGGKVTFVGGAKRVGTATTSATGAFAESLALARKTTFRATIVVPTREVGCLAALPASSAPRGCVSATLAGYTLTTAPVTATPKKR